MIIAEKGYEGYQKNIQIMREQATLMERMKEKSATLQNAWESVTGTAANFAATVGGVFAPELREAFTSINAFIGGPLTKWVEANKEHILLGVKIVGGFLAMKLAIGGTAYALSMFVGGPLRALRTGWTMLRAAKDLYSLMRLGGIGRGAMVLRMLGMSAEGAAKAASFFGRSWAVVGRSWSVLGNGAMWLGKVFAGPLAAGIRAAAMALLGIPGIGWITLAVVGIGALIWKYWGPIKGFVKGMWGGLKEGLSSALAAVRPGLQSLGGMLSGMWDGLKSAVGAVWVALKPLGGIMAAAFAPVRPLLVPIIGLVRSAWQWFSELITPIRAAGPESQAMGQAVGQALGKIIAKGAELLGFFAGLPAKFLQFGTDIVQGLLNGIGAKWDALKAKVGGMAGMVSDVFRKKQDINSPSRVFMGFGMNIGEGAAIGMHRSAPLLRTAAGALAAVTMAAFTPGVIQAQPLLPSMPPAVPSIATTATVSWKLPELPQQVLRLMPLLSKLPAIGPLLQPLVPQMAGLATQQPPSRLSGILQDAQRSQPAAPAATAAPASIQVHYAPQITVQGAQDAPATQTAVQSALVNNQRELERMLRRLMEERERRALR